MKLSTKVQNLAPSVTLQAAARAKELKAQGLDVLSLTVVSLILSHQKILKRLPLLRFNQVRLVFTPSLQVFLNCVKLSSLT